MTEPKIITNQQFMTWAVTTKQIHAELDKNLILGQNWVILLFLFRGNRLSKGAWGIYDILQRRIIIKKKKVSKKSLKLKLSSSLICLAFLFFVSFPPPPQRGYSYYSTPGLKGSKRRQISLIHPDYCHISIEILFKSRLHFRPITF